MADRRRETEEVRQEKGDGTRDWKQEIGEGRRETGDGRL